MASDRESLLDVLAEHLTTESKWMLVTLFQEKRAIHKEELRDLSNESFLNYQKNKKLTNDETPLLSSRHLLDKHTDRLEGAGLVTVQEIGRIRMYTISPIGEELLLHITNKKKNN